MRNYIPKNPLKLTTNFSKKKVLKGTNLYI